MNNKTLEEHIRHCMLYEFRKGSKATVATKNICDVYPNALDVRKCQRWFSKFRSGNYDLSDSFRSGRPTKLDNDMLRAEVEANSFQTIEELSNTLNQPWSTVQEHLKQIGKKNKAGIWVPNDYSEEDEVDETTKPNTLPQQASNRKVSADVKQIERHSSVGQCKSDTKKS